MAVMTPREENWTDEPNLREELGEMRAEIRGLEKKFDAKFDGLNRTMQIGFGIVGGVMAAMLGLLGLIATQL